MTQQDQEILQLVQRIQLLCMEESRKESAAKKERHEDELFYRMAKIREITTALLPRIEASIR